MYNKQDKIEEIIIDPLELESVEITEDEIFSMLQASGDVVMQTDFITAED